MASPLPPKKDDMLGKMPGDFTQKKIEVDPKIADKLREMDALIAKTFSTPTGKRVLQYLRDETIEKPVFRRIGMDLAGVNEGFFREGQNELVRQLEMRIKRANSG